MANTEIRLATGHITKASLQSTSSYLLSNFPLQADQPSWMAWSLAAYADVSDYAPVGYQAALDGSIATGGYAEFTLVFSVLTSTMYSYLIAQFLPSVENKDTTAQIVDPRNAVAADAQLVVFQGKLNRPRVDVLRGRWRYWNGTKVAIEVPFSFTRGVVV